MKINEPFGEPLEYDSSDNAGRMDAEILARMKSEFHEFLGSIRDRLHTVSESLIELDREFSRPPQVSEPKVETAVTDPSEATQGFTQKVAEEPAEAQQPGSPGITLQASQDAKTAPRSQFDIWPEATVPAAEAPAPVVQAPAPAVQAPAPAVQAPAPAAEAPVSEVESPAPMSSPPIDTSSDPMERLNAIKARLARQIENS